MKTLYLVRHAKSEKLTKKLNDFDRDLLKKGRKDAKKMAANCKSGGGIPQIIISSPAKRAVKTARIFANTFGYSKDEIIIDSTIYEGTKNPEENAIINIIHNIDDSINSALIVGHDPSMSLAAGLIGKDFSENIPASGVVKFCFQNKYWKTITPGHVKTRYYDYPGKEKKLLLEMQADLEAKLQKNIYNTLKNLNQEIADKLQTLVKKVSREIGQKFYDENCK